MRKCYSLVPWEGNCETEFSMQDVYSEVPLESAPGEWRGRKQDRKQEVQLWCRPSDSFYWLYRECWRSLKSGWDVQAFILPCGSDTVCRLPRKEHDLARMHSPGLRQTLKSWQLEAAYPQQSQQLQQHILHWREIWLEAYLSSPLIDEKKTQFTGNHSAETKG